LKRKVFENKELVFQRLSNEQSFKQDSLP